MTAERVILWRHGQTDWNLQLRIQGAVDFPLNDTGREQARLAAQNIAVMEPSKIVSSPLSRARDTAKEVAQLVGVTVELDARLEERNYGEWEGLTREEIVERNPEQFKVWEDGGNPAGLGIETSASVGYRVAEAIVDIAESMDGGTLLIASHGAATRAAIAVLLGQNPDEWAGVRGMDNCRWAVLLPQYNRNPLWRLVNYNASC